MGSDMTADVEFRGKGGAWLPVPIYIGSGSEIRPAGLNVMRDYVLFGILCGHRFEHELGPISPPRGLPADVSHEVRAEAASECCGISDASWITLHELVANRRRYLDKGQCPSAFDRYTEFPCDRLGRFSMRVRDRAHDGLVHFESDRDVRVVYWFDQPGY